MKLRILIEVSVILIFCQPSDVEQRFVSHQEDNTGIHSVNHNQRSKFAPVDWNQRGQQELEDALNVSPKWAPAKNVIIFIGDGMGVSTLTATRMFKAQRAGKSVTEGKLAWEQMPYTGLIKVYNTDQQAPDSAGTATAFLSGEKTKAGVIGVNQHVPRGNCSAMAGNELTSIIHRGIEQGKWTGIVSTSAFTAATTSSAYGHSPDRYWRVDSDVPEQDRNTCWDLARQMVHSEVNKNIRVLQGGGRSYFRSLNMTDPEYVDVQGMRGDGQDLLQDWVDIHTTMAPVDGEVVYARNQAEFDAVDTNKIQYLLGCYEPDNMKQEADRQDEDPTDWGEPSLTQMVNKTIDILSRGPQGYILLAEGDRIDHGHHQNNAYRSMMDVLGLDEAVQLAMEKTSAEDTLIYVTADHSHALTMSGYPALEADVLGLVVDQNNDLVLAEDDLPHLILSYANGPGYVYHRMEAGLEVTRRNLTDEDTTGRDYQQDAGINLESETHTGEDVAVYARGPMAHLFTGQHEQNFLAHAAMYAACVGPNTENCDNPRGPQPCDTSGAENLGAAYVIIICVFLVVLC